MNFRTEEGLWDSFIEVYARERRLYAVTDKTVGTKYRESKIWQLSGAITSTSTLLGSPPHSYGQDKPTRQHVRVH